MPSFRRIGRESATSPYTTLVDAGPGTAVECWARMYQDRSVEVLVLGLVIRRSLQPYAKSEGLALMILAAGHAGFGRAVLVSLPEPIRNRG